MRVRVAPGLFPPELVVQVKALACELPAKHGLPLSRWSTRDLVQQVQHSGLVASVSGSTLWRWLHEDAIRPWYHRSWIFPRDPDFAVKAGRILDLYARQWQGAPLKDDEFVISADEKTSIQARRRKHPTQRCRPRTPMHVEHEYFRCGAWTYIAGLDVHRARVMGRLELANGIVPFDRLVHQVMRREPYASARRVFWLVDQGSSHRPTTFPDRLRSMYPNALAVPLPVHASWLNQVEIYFSILERKALTPNDFPNLAAVMERIHSFEQIFNRAAVPFAWTFTCENLRDLLKRIPSIVLTKSAQAGHSHVLKATA